MPLIPRPIRSLLWLALCATVSACGAARGPALGLYEQALLRLEYLERASLLPALTLDRIDLPTERRLGNFSQMVWRIQSDSHPGRELFRPLPVPDVDLLLRRSMVHTLEEYGFNMSHWQRPSLRLRVEVEKLVLSSLDKPTDTRSCDLTLVFRIEELPAGLEIQRFRSRSKLELPGSWTVARGEEMIWLPLAGGPDPIALAATDATERFLSASLKFWQTPALWQLGVINLSDADRR